jgi:hypothetical protein
MTTKDQASIAFTSRIPTERIGTLMNLLPFFEWCYQTSIGEMIRDSNWLFPVIETFHLLGLGLTAGAVLVADLRLLGVGLSRTPIAQIDAAVRPWLLGGLILLFASGIPLFLSESIKCLFNYAFWVKMISLFLVLIFTFTVRRRVMQSGITSNQPLVGRFTALISLGLWFGVAGGGRWIGFS